MLSQKINLTDREIFTQMLERDVTNLYGNLSGKNAFLKLPQVQNKIYSYADFGISYLADLFFGEVSAKTNAEDASEIAKFMASDKINEYRDKIIKQRNQNNGNIDNSSDNINIVKTNEDGQ